MTDIPNYPNKVVWKPQPGSQVAFLSSTAIYEVLFEGTRGGGKCLANDSKVLTNNGWKLVGEVEPNDLLVAEDGSYTELLGIYPQELKDCYEVEFLDGAKITVGHDHKWKVGSGKNFRRDGWQVKSTKELFSSKDVRDYFIPYMGGAHGGIQWSSLDTDPYVIGLIAGDGTIPISGRGICIYNEDQEIIDYMQSIGWKLKTYGDTVPRLCATVEQSEPYREIMKEAARNFHKEIPNEVLCADAATRLACLQGLMDSDGSVDKEGRCGFTTISERLRDQVVELVWSLGGKASWGEKKFSSTRRSDQHDFYYQVYISHLNNFNPFRLSRKADRVKNTTKKLTRTIASIKPVKSVPSTCFAVAHKSHCFVAQNYIVTHNTDCLLMSFCMHVGKGFGAAWKGILFRQTYKQLTDVISKTQKWIPQIWPEAKYNQSEHTWTWPSGEKLLLRQFDKEADYWNYHGHEYPWIGWEELCNWPNDQGYKRMMSCCRSSTPGMPRMIRATTNPYGPGHGWVKLRFNLPHSRSKVRTDVVEEGVRQRPRLAIHSTIHENKIMLENDPEYVSSIAMAARNESERKAWLEGSWDIVAGGMFDGAWDAKYNVVKPFNIPPSWRIQRSFDWGSSKPFSVGWWAVSNGEDVVLPGGKVMSTVRGDIFRIGEWYGWTGKPNEGLRMLATDITAGIVEREIEWGYRRPREKWRRVTVGVADSQIFAAENGNCIATDMMCSVRLDDGYKYPGVVWIPADKKAGSRVTGWQQICQVMKDAHPNPSGPREHRGLFVFDTCDQFLRTVPSLSRDEDDPDDVNTDAEDHCADECRYFVRSLGVMVRVGRSKGSY